MRYEWLSLGWGIVNLLRDALGPLAPRPRQRLAGGLGGTRTPDALLRTEALYPLSYEAADLIIDSVEAGRHNRQRFDRFPKESYA